MSNGTPLLPGQKLRPTLTKEQVRRLREARAEGVTLEELSRRFGASTAFIQRALKEDI